MESIQANVRGKILELRFPFAGKVIWVGFEIGDIVRTGQELALKVILESIDGLIYGMPGKLTIYPER